MLLQETTGKEFKLDEGNGRGESAWGREEEWRGDCSHVVTSVRGSVRIERAGIASALAAAESRDSSYSTRCFFRRGFASEGMISAGSAS